MADDRRARRRGGALWFEPRRLVCARIRTRDARDDAPSAITQSIVRSIAHRSINKKSTHKTVSLLTPRRRRRRRRVSRDACESYARHHLAHVFSRSSVVVTMHASIRARHHASSFHQSPRVPTTDADDASSTGRVRRHRTSDVTCVFRVFRGSTRARRPRSRRSCPASHANAFFSRSRPRLDGPAATTTPCAIDDAIDARDVVVGVGVDSARATVVESSSSVRRRRGFHSRIRVRCHANPSSSLTPCARAVGYVCAVSSREGGGVGCARGVRDDGGGCGRVVRAVRE